MVLLHRVRVSEEKTPKMIVIPRYEPVFVEPNLKEYETQVLEMSVPIDEMAEDGTFARKNNRRKSSGEHFSLDSISYITKDRMSYGGGGGGGGGGNGSSSQSPATSDHTRTTAATYRGGAAEAMPGHYSSLDGDDDPITPIRNPLFTR